MTASSRKTGSTSTGGAPRSTSSGRPASRGPRRSIVRPTRSSSSKTSRSARSAPASIRREVQQVRDEPVEVFDLPVDGLGALALVGLAEPGLRAERSGGRPDRRQRRPQVVGHRLEQGRLQRVGLPGDVRGLGLGREPILAEGLPDLVGRGGQQSGLGPVRLALVARSRRPDGAVRLVTGLHPDPVDADTARRPGSRRSRLVDADPNEPARRRASAAGRGGGPSPVAARRPTCRPRRAPGRGSGPSAIQTRAIRLSSRRIAAIVGRTAGVEARVASARLTWNRERASRSRATASSARRRWRAASWPTAIPVNRRRTRFSPRRAGRPAACRAARRTGSCRAGTPRPTRGPRPAARTRSRSTTTATR